VLKGQKPKEDQKSGEKGKIGELGSKDSNLDCMIQSHESCRWTTSQQGAIIIKSRLIFKASRAAGLKNLVFDTPGKYSYNLHYS
jgi:hypothetical protein